MRDTTGLDVACCLWEKYAEQFEPLIESGNDQPLICFIRFAKIILFRGTIRLSNAYDGSVVTLNPTVKEAIEFKQKMQQDDLSLALYDNKNESMKVIKKQVEDLTQIEVKTISEFWTHLRLGVAKSYVQLNQWTQIGVGSTLDVIFAEGVLLGLVDIWLVLKSQCSVVRFAVLMSEMCHQSTSCIYLLKMTVRHVKSGYLTLLQTPL
ncbi:uncharacterized protein LOC130504528 isoform X2 [Raphanus sativus]|nr:uncharacterized protein LOC130504528 isoform X2 [Raphanus sativus]